MFSFISRLYNKAPAVQIEKRTPVRLHISCYIYIILFTYRQAGFLSILHCLFFQGSMSTLWGKGTASVRKVLSLFEMKEALEQYDQEVAGREVLYFCFQIISWIFVCLLFRGREIVIAV